MKNVLKMSDARRLQISLLASLLVNAAVLLLTTWGWHYQPVPFTAPRPRIKLVQIAQMPPPTPKPILSAKPVPPPVPKPHPIKPKPRPKRRPGAHVKSSSPAPPSKAAGGSDAGAAAPRIAAAPPVHVIARAQPAPLVVHNFPVPLPPIPLPSLSPGVVINPPLPKAIPAANTGPGASGADTSGKGSGAGEGAGKGSGIGSGTSQDAGEPFGVGKGLAGDGGPRHVVYVLDISGSMTSRIARADSEIRKSLAGLRPDETFDIVAFNVAAYPFDPDMVPATPGMIRHGSTFLDTLQVTDGTNLEVAMMTALSMHDVNEIVLLTDGVPTQGITDFDDLAHFIRRHNRNHARISTVGMVGKNPGGSDQSFEATQLLQQIAADSGGACEIVPLGVAAE